MKKLTMSPALQKVVDNWHDALDDSRNTATIFKELSDPEEFKKSVAYINEFKNPPKESGTTLGDLIDFSKFHFDD